jgi:hypothetical protein
MKGDNAPKVFQIHPWSKEIENEVKIPWEEKIRWGNQIYQFLGSWFHPRTQESHGGSKKSPMGGLEGVLTVVLERIRVRSERIGEVVSSVRVVKPTKTG